jgi:hypothetical protein
MSAIHPDSAKILADLPLRPRPGLYVDAQADERGSFLIMQDRADDCGGTAIIGLACPEEDDEADWYLGCIECRAVVDEADSGMCRLCREDTTWQEQLHADEYWEV